MVYLLRDVFLFICISFLEYSNIPRWCFFFFFFALPTDAVRREDDMVLDDAKATREACDDLSPPDFGPDVKVKDTPKKDIDEWAKSYVTNGGEVAEAFLDAVTSSYPDIKWGDDREDAPDGPYGKTVIGGTIQMLCIHMSMEKTGTEIANGMEKLLKKFMNKYDVGLLQKSENAKATREACDDLSPPDFGPDVKVKDTPKKDIDEWAKSYVTNGGEVAEAFLDAVTSSYPDIKWGDDREDAPDGPYGKTVIGGTIQMLCIHMSMEKTGTEIANGMEKLLKKFMNKYGVGLLQKSENAKATREACDDLSPPDFGPDVKVKDTPKKDIDEWAKSYVTNGGEVAEAFLDAVTSSYPDIKWGDDREDAPDGPYGKTVIGGTIQMLCIHMSMEKTGTEIANGMEKLLKKFMNKYDVGLLQKSENAKATREACDDLSPPDFGPDVKVKDTPKKDIDEWAKSYVTNGGEVAEAFLDAVTSSYPDIKWGDDREDAPDGPYGKTVIGGTIQMLCIHMSMEKTGTEIANGMEKLLKKFMNKYDVGLLQKSENAKATREACDDLSPPDFGPDVKVKDTPKKDIDEWAKSYVTNGGEVAEAFLDAVTSSYPDIKWGDDREDAPDGPYGKTVIGGTIQMLCIHMSMEKTGTEIANGMEKLLKKFMNKYDVGLLQKSENAKLHHNVGGAVRIHDPIHVH